MKRVESVLIAIVCVFLAVLFLYLSGYALLFTSVIDDNGYIHEPIVERRDDPLRGVLMLLCGVLLLWLFGLVEKRIPLRAAVIALLLWTVAAGAFWVCAARTIPRADAGSIALAARRIIGNNFAELKRAGGYFNQHPYQVGFLLVSEIFQRIFGLGNDLSIQLLNAVCLAGAYAAVLRLTWQATGSQRITRYTCLFLFFCIQPVLYCTFLYGNILSITCALWAGSVVLEVAQGASKWRFLLAGLLCGLSVLFKPNGWLPTFALAIVSVLWLLSEKKWRVLPLVLALFLGPVLVTGGVKAMYQARSGADLSKGVPMTAYLAMGLQESSRAPGWYNEYVDRVYQSVSYKPAKASQRAVKNIGMRLEAFRKDPAYTLAFFHEKMVSQWNETTFEAIWISKVCKYDKQLRLPIARAMLDGDLRKPLEDWMEGYTILLYLGFALGAGLFALGLLGKMEPISRVCGLGLGFLAVTVIGAFLYHMLFEAKSQYLFVYLPVMAPLAASAAARLPLSLRKRSLS